MDEIWFEGKRFTKFGNYWRSARKFLHRAIWESHNGPIAKGDHVHHIDGDRENNDISNLECKSGREHLSDHHTGHTRRPDAAIKAGVEWRKTEEGKSFMSEMGRRNQEFMRKDREFVCECCAKQFIARDTGGNRFCSGACKAKHRRYSGVDKVECTCVQCGTLFKTEKFRPSLCCSKGCGRKMWLSTPEGKEHLENLASRKRSKK